MNKIKLLLVILTLSISSSFAQDAASGTDANVEEIVVTGMRSNLQNAQEIKQGD